MATQNNTLMLYSPQSDVVINTLERDGVCFSKREYVVKKYAESAPIFTSAYDWFVAELNKYLPKPVGAEYPYWAFMDLDSFEPPNDGEILYLDVPINEAIFFDVYDWNKILRLQYIGENDADEKQFKQMLADYGIKRESDIMLTNFYPDLKLKVQDSWQRLFHQHEKIKAGDINAVGAVQVGLWQLKKEWLRK